MNEGLILKGLKKGVRKMTLNELAKKVNANDDTEFFMTVKKNEDGSEHGPEYYVLLQTHSPLGEDLPEEFEVDTIKELVKEMRQRADNYDADEHAELWIGSRGQNGVPNCSIRELLDDAEKIGKMYEALADVLEKESGL